MYVYVYMYMYVHLCVGKYIFDRCIILCMCSTPTRAPPRRGSNRYHVRRRRTRNIYMYMYVYVYMYMYVYI